MVSSKTIGAMSGGRQEMEQEGWNVCRTLEGGTSAMRKARENYTPKTEPERKDVRRYNARLARTNLYPMFRDTVTKLAALPFRKPPTVTGQLGPNRQRLIENADRRGKSLATFAQSIYRDAIGRGQGMFLVDNVPTTKPDGSAMTLADAAMADARPYFCRIAPDNFLGLTYEMRFGRPVYTSFRYRQIRWQSTADGDVAVEQVREWTETEVRIWEKRLATPGKPVDRKEEAANPSDGDHVLVETINHGSPVGIPLVILYTDEVDVALAKPPLLELAWTNVAYWNSRSTQGDCLAYSRAPILTISGADGKTAEERPIVSAGSTITSKSDKLSVTFAEISGSSLDAGWKEALELRLEGEAQGMRPLQPMAGGPLTATGEVRADGNETSLAQTWVEALEWAIYQGIEIASKWDGEALPEEFKWTLDKESSLLAGRATDIPALQQMYRDGAISLPTYLREMVARGVIVTVEDVDTEVEEIEGKAEKDSRARMLALVEDLKRERGEGEGEPDADPEADPEGDPGAAPGDPDAVVA